MSDPEFPPLPWRVVLDTNILISAYRFGGKPRAILELAERKAFVLLISEPLQLELVRVLAEKFFMPQNLISATCSRLWEVSQWIKPRIHLDLCPDESDNRFLECAIKGKAGYIVTGDRHLLSLPPIEGLAILQPDPFLKLFNAAGAGR